MPTQWLPRTILATTIVAVLSLGAGTIDCSAGVTVGMSQINALPTDDPWIDDPHWSQLRPDVVTSHTPWARPYVGRRLKVVVIAPRWTHRATIELEQRFDLDIDPVLTEFHHKWGDTDHPHYSWAVYGSEALTTSQALASLRDLRRPDVVLLGALAADVMPLEVEEALLEVIARGTGLVIVNPHGVPASVQTLLDEAAEVEAESVHPVVDGVPTRQLPPLTAQHPRALIGEGMHFREGVGGVRFAVVDYAPLDRVRSVNCYLSPPGANRGDAVRDLHYEYYCSLVGRTLLWAGRNLPTTRLAGWEKLDLRIDTKGKDATIGALEVDGQDVPDGAVAALTVRDRDGFVVHAAQIPVTGAAVPLEVGRLPGGDWYADVILRDGERRTLDWGTHAFTADSGAVIMSITTNDRSHRRDQPVALQVALDGDLETAELNLTVTDTHGRTIHAETVPATPSRILHADVRNALTIQCTVQATLRRADIVLARHATRLLVRQPPADADTYLYAVWGSANPSFVRRRSAEVLAAEGITTGILSGDIDQWARLDIRPVPYLTRYYPGPETPEKGLCVRVPCMTDPSWQDLDDARLTKVTEQEHHYSPQGYSLGDDQGMLLSHQDACISDTCLAAFRSWLEEQYETIEALNTSWSTKYASFVEAMPASIDAVQASGHFPRWADHRLYMDRLFVARHREAKAVVRAVDPEARVGFEGPLLDDSWYGYAWKDLLGAIDVMAPYPNAWKFDLVRSFARPGLLFGGWYGGYAAYRDADDLRAYPWFLLFNGCNSYWFFADYGWSEAGHPAQGIAPDLRVLPCLRDTTTQVKRIQEGIDRLVLGARRQTHGVAVYFSRPSVHAATLMPPVPTRDFNTNPDLPHYMARPNLKWALNTEAMLRLLDDAGVGHRFVDRTQIIDGILAREDIRLLVMPQGHAVSAVEARAIHRFVEEGGALLADVRPAVFDEHVRPVGEDSLDELFGVRRTGSVTDPLEEQMVHLAGGDDAVPMPVDTTVTAVDATAAWTSAEGVPLFIQRAHGRGQACLVNMAIQHYLTLRAADRGQPFVDALQRWLVEAGITADVTVVPEGEHTAPVRLFAYRDGGARLVGLLRPHKRLLDEPELFVDRAPRRFVLRLPEIGHLYDVIDRRYIGHVDQHALEVPAATPMLFASLPYRVTDLPLQVTVTTRRIAIDMAVETSSVTPGRHVIHVVVTDPTGHVRREYGANVIADGGRARHGFNLALNAPSGRWHVMARDVATGVVGNKSWDF